MREYVDRVKSRDLGLPSPSDFYPTGAETSNRTRKVSSREKIGRVLSRSTVIQQEFIEEARQKSLFLDYKLKGKRYVIGDDLGFKVDCSNDNF